MSIEWADTLRTWRRAYQAEGKGRLADLLARGSGNDSDPRQFSAWLDASVAMDNAAAAPEDRP